MILKCKICGGNLEIQEDSKTAICEYCGTKQVIPKTENAQKNQLCDRANHYRMNSEFDKAIAIYESILNDDITDGEIYWQLVLCEYGVEYVKDKKTDKYIPTCNRTKNISIFANENYKNAIKYSNEEQRKIYQEEAERINAIQKNALNISSKEEPFDIFICYKETDDNGQRTQDSVIAQDLYNNLTNQGYKVFFSKITLENKLGSEYEPYIFAALNSSKIMIVLGSKKEYFNAPWVKNEWIRFLTLTKKDNSKILLPCYKDINPYDLPEEFAHLQALDLSRIGVISDLKNKIDLTLSVKNTKTKYTKKETKPLEPKKIKKIVITSISVLIAIATVIILIIVFKESIIPESKYKEAEQLMIDEKYQEAIHIFEELDNYKDSKVKITECNKKIREKTAKDLEKYIGKYDNTEDKVDPANEYDTPYGYVLEITSAGSPGIEFNLTNCGHRVATISSKARLNNDGIYQFSFKDSWFNVGEGTMTLLDDSILINLKITKHDDMANYSIGDGEIEFKLSNKKTLDSI